MENLYTLKQLENNTYLVMFDDEVILNHQGNPFPALSETIAKYLCDDLNEVNQERESFSYCVLSTMMEAPTEYELDIDELLQWDRVFRLSPAPPALPLELSILKEIKPHLNAEWVNLSLNYGQSIEEMTEMKVDFVPDEIIKELNGLVENMNSAERFMSKLLYVFMGYFSMTLPIFWVTKKIENDDLLKAFWIFEYGESPTQKDIHFLNNRLDALRKIQQAYLDKEEIFIA